MQNVHGYPGSRLDGIRQEIITWATFSIQVGVFEGEVVVGTCPECFWKFLAVLQIWITCLLVAGMIRRFPLLSNAAIAPRRASTQARVNRET